MQTFTYTLIFKIIFRFGNIIVTLLLSIYLIPVFYYIDQNMILILPLIIGLIILYMVNRTYLTYYLILPYKIEADDEKMICSDFLLSNKVVTIYYKDIDKLQGGVFSGRSSGIMKLRDGKSKLQVGFSQKMNNSEKLIALILSKVSKDLYNEVMKRDGKSKLQVGFSQKMNNSEKLIALILSKVSKDLYNEVMNNLTERRHRKNINPK